MKILHTESSTGWGGQEIRILTESRKFIAMGHEVHLAANHDSLILLRSESYGVNPHGTNLRKKTLPALLSLMRTISRINPDIVSCHSSTDHWLSALSRIFLRKKFAIVRTRHISAPIHQNFPTKWLYNSGADQIMTTGTVINNILTSNQFVDSKKITSVPTGIDVSIYKPGNSIDSKQLLNIPSDFYVFGIVATLRSWKGHSYLIEAFKQLSFPNAKLLIVGDGPKMQELKNLVQELGLDHVIFTDNVPNPIHYLNAMDCFVLPSYANEGVPQALLQAMACGLPIITTRIGGIPECSKSYANKIYVQEKDVTALMTAMNSAPSSFSLNDLNKIPYTPNTLDTLYESALEIYRKALKYV